MAISHNNGYLYVASYYTRRIFRIRISDSVCDWNVYVSYPRSISIRNNIMYTTTAYGLGNTMIYQLQHQHEKVVQHLVVITSVTRDLIL